MVIAWSGPMPFDVQAPCDWQGGIVAAEPAARGPGSFTLAPRSIVVLRR